MYYWCHIMAIISSLCQIRAAKQESIYAIFLRRQRKNDENERKKSIFIVLRK